MKIIRPDRLPVGLTATEPRVSFAEVDAVSFQMAIYNYERLFIKGIGLRHTQPRSTPWPRASPVADAD